MNKLRLFILGILFTIPMLLSAQIKGTVTEKSTGYPLPDVNIKVKGTSIGTTTDFDGNYSLPKAKIGDEIVFSYVGFAEQIIKATTKTINVVLVEGGETLNEVVLIGYGSTTKKDATGSVAMVKTKDLKNEGIAAPEQMLVGKIAGVVVTPTGAPGGGGVIRIRESTSLFANQNPLIVIDGVPGGNLNSLNNNDIESFTVLKDASATAIYGTRGSNGVILITTKKGKVGKLKFQYNSSYTIKKLINTPDALSADEFRKYVTENGNAQQISLLGDSNTNWIDQIFDTGKGMNHDFNMSGGSKALNFRLGLGMFEEDGILNTANFEKGTYSLNLGSKLFNDKLKINASYKYTMRKYRNADTGAISSAISFDPTKPVHIANQDFGGYYQWLNPDGTKITVGAPANPVALLNQKKNMYYGNGGIGNIKFNYELPYIKGLNANLVLGLDHGKGHGTDQTNANSWTTFNNNFDGDGNPINYGYKGNNYNEYNNKLLDFYLNYKRDIESLDGNFDVMGGYSYNNYTSFGSSKSNLQNDPGQAVIDTDRFGHSNLQSFFGRANLNVKNKYLLTVSLRRDATSRLFYSNESWANFPSLAFAWKLSEEKFLSNNQTINNLKLRLGWGKVGQQDGLPDNPALATYLLGNDQAQYQLGNGFVHTSRAEAYNPLLKWETTTTYNFGIDYGILDNKFSGALEMFFRKSDDLLNRIPLPAGTSLSNVDWANIGNMENKGVEFNVNYKAINQEHKHLNFGFNTAYNTIKITKLTNSNSEDYSVAVGGFTGGVGNTIQTFSVDYAPFSYYVYQQVYDSNGTPIEGVYVDRNGDGSIDSKDKYRFKKPNADMTFGLNTNFDYKNFDFNMFWRGSIGNYVYNNVDSQHGFKHQMLNDAFPNVISNGVANVLETGFENGGAERYQSDYYIQDASFVKLDNLTIGYSFNKLKALQKVRLYASVQNVYTFTKYTGLDPEVFGGIDYNVYPKPRTFAFGLNVNF